MLILFEKSEANKLLLSQQDDKTFIYIIKINKISADKNNSNTYFLDSNKCNIENNFDSEKKISSCNNSKFSSNVLVNNNEYYEDFIDDMHDEILEGDKDIRQNTNNYVQVNEINYSETSKINDSNDISEELSSVAYKISRLSNSQKEQVKNLLLKYKKLFSDKPGCVKDFEYRIKLTTENPIIRKYYSVPLKWRKRVRELLNSMLCDGIIERAISPHCNPLRVVGKSDEDIRICLDARVLNSMIEDDREAPPIINEMLQEYEEVLFYSKMDATNGYYQILLHKDSRPLTAFMFDSTLYQYVRLPFGVKTAGSAFIRALKFALQHGSEA